MVNDVWLSMPERFPNIELGAFMVMPNHFHAIVIMHDHNLVGAGLVPAPNVDTPTKGATTRVAPTNAPTLGQIIGAIKSIATHEYIIGVDEKGWPQFNKRLWQRNYYERIIRNEQEMDAIWRYIEANPTNWTDDEENPQNARVNLPAG